MNDNFSLLDDTVCNNSEDIIITENRDSLSFFTKKKEYIQENGNDEIMVFASKP